MSAEWSRGRRASPGRSSRRRRRFAPDRVGHRAWQPGLCNPALRSQSANDPVEYDQTSISQLAEPGADTIRMKK
jgi:hypothetical protein